MCGRFALHAHPDVIALQFELAQVPDFAARYNIAPSSDVLVVREDAERGRFADLCRWGLIPAWAKDPAIGNKLANARGETVAEKPSFRNAFRRGRCLVPASGFYEWQAVAGRKQPWYIRPVGDELFALAGISDVWHGPQGALRTVSLITTEPNELMREIHDRMPVIIERAKFAAWLDPANRDPEKLKAFIGSFPAQRMEAYPVGKAVSNARSEGAELNVRQSRESGNDGASDRALPSAIDGSSRSPPRSARR